jgi:hypothetical protein
VAPVQVLIEAVIIQVELDKEKQLGVNFAVLDNLGQQLGTIGSGFEINNNVGFNQRHNQSQRAARKLEEHPLGLHEQSYHSMTGWGYAIHVVRRKETLQSIAADRLGDARRSDEIAGLIGDLLGQGGRLIPGQRLLLPADAGPSRAEP